MADVCGCAQKSRRRIPEEELLAVLDGWLTGLSLREVATILYGEARVEEAWCRGGWMRARVRWRLRTALRLMNGGYRALLV